MNSELAGLAAVHYRATFVGRYLDYLKHLLNRYDWKSRDSVRHLSISFFTFVPSEDGSLPVIPVPLQGTFVEGKRTGVGRVFDVKDLSGENSVGNLHPGTRSLIVPLMLPKILFCSRGFLFFSDYNLLLFYSLPGTSK